MIRRAMHELISPPFRERMMVVVTEVNGCRYCSYFHSHQALTGGVTEFGLGNCQWIDFSDNFEHGLAKHRKFLRETDSPKGVLEPMKDRLAPRIGGMMKLNSLRFFLDAGSILSTT